MLNFEQMPMEPEVTENFILQIFQYMKKLDLINSEFEFGRCSLRVKISLLIEILLLIIKDTIALECIRHITSWTRSRRRQRMSELSGSKQRRELQ